MLDFPQFTEDTLPRRDAHGSVLGALRRRHRRQHVCRPHVRSVDGVGQKVARRARDEDDSDGRRVPQHISNNAPTNLAGPDETQRKEGVAIAKRWLDGCKVLGVKSMRMNSTSALGPSIRPPAIPRDPTDGYPRNLDIGALLKAAIESYKEMADYGGNLGIRVTIENHWGLAENPMNIRTIIDEVNHPYCEASPDFCNWEAP